ncbi:ras guanine nucleotide exchange factor domain-containing protein [Obelidium mucronatum]|nr:ras guanine nucleotide exchange factor domain-containing protein [Obelidium mucronatum]
MSLESKEATPPFVLLTTSEILVLTDVFCEGMANLHPTLTQNTIDAIFVTGGCDLYPFLSVDVANSAVDLVSLMSRTMIKHQTHMNRVSSKPAFVKWITHINALSGILLDTVQLLEKDELMLLGRYKPSMPSRQSILSQQTASPPRTPPQSHSTLADINRKSLQNSSILDSFGFQHLSRSHSGSSTLIMAHRQSLMMSPNVPLSVVVESQYQAPHQQHDPALTVDEISSLPAEYRAAIRRYTSIEDLSEYMTSAEQNSHNLKKWNSLLLDLSVPYVTGEFVLDSHASIEGVAIDFSQLRLTPPSKASTKQTTKDYFNNFSNISGINNAVIQRARLRLSLRIFGYAVNNLFTSLQEILQDPVASLGANSRKLGLVVTQPIESLKSKCLELINVCKQIENTCFASLNKRHAFRAAVKAAASQSPISGQAIPVRELMLMQSLNRINASEVDVKLALEVITKNLDLLLAEPLSCCFSLRIEKLVGMVLVEEQMVDDVVKAGDNGVVVLEEEEEIAALVGREAVGAVEVSRVSQNRIALLESRSLLQTFHSKQDASPKANLLVLTKSSEHIIFEAVISSKNGQRVSDPTAVRVKYATIPKLVEQLSKGSTLDAPFVLSFLQSYSTFIGVLPLLDIVKDQVTEIARIPDDLRELNLEDYKQQVILPPVLSFLNFLHLWISVRPLEFVAVEAHEKTLQLLDFVVQEVGEAVDQFVATIRRELAENKFLDSNFFNNYRLGDLTTPIASSAIASILFKSDPRVIAEQLALLDFEIYNRIQPTEILGYISRNRTSLDDVVPASSTLASEDQSFGSVSVLLNRFNFLVSYMTSLIIQGSSFKARSDMIVLLVRVAKHCVDIKALNAAQAIVSSLASASVYRLTRTWDNVPKPTLTLLTSLRVCFSPSLNFHNLRVLLASTESNVLCIPWLGLSFRDIIHISESYPVYKNVSCGAIDSALRFQKVEGTVGISAVPRIREALLSMDGLLATANAQFEASLLAEPSTSAGDRAKSFLNFLFK